MIMNRTNLFIIIILLLLGLSTTIMASPNHEPADTTETEDTTIGLGLFMGIILLISLGVTGFIYIIYRMQSNPDTFPITKLIYTAVITLLVNSIIFAYLYLEI